MDSEPSTPRPSTPPRPSEQSRFFRFFTSTEPGNLNGPNFIRDKCNVDKSNNVSIDNSKKYIPVDNITRGFESIGVGIVIAEGIVATCSFIQDAYFSPVVKFSIIVAGGTTAGFLFTVFNIVNTIIKCKVYNHYGIVSNYGPILYDFFANDFFASDSNTKDNIGTINSDNNFGGSNFGGVTAYNAMIINNVGPIYNYFYG